MSDDVPTPRRSAPRDMNLRAAVLASALLFAASLGMLWAADEAVDVAAIAGGTGLILSGSLLGLTFLARRWELQRRAYVVTTMGDRADEARAASSVDSETSAASSATA